MTAMITILTKSPEPGRVKTRLASDIGADAAAEVHTHLALHTIKLAQSTGLEVKVAIDGDLAGPFAQQLRTDGVKTTPQVQGSLGDRLKHALSSPGRQMALGSDCVTFDPQWLIEAAQCSAPVALGPADDGGYWAIAIDNATANLTDLAFNDMPWSSTVLFERTVARLHASRIEVSILPEAYDVDTLEDLQRLIVDDRCPASLKTTLSMLL